MAVGGMYLFVAGGFDGNLQHASSAARAALDIMCHLLRGTFSKARVAPILQIGMNTGPVAAGVIGTHAMNWHIFGGEFLSQLYGHMITPIARLALFSALADDFNFLRKTATFIVLSPKFSSST